jgi:hypothetical protein
MIVFVFLTITILSTNIIQQMECFVDHHPLPRFSLRVELRALGGGGYFSSGYHF